MSCALDTFTRRASTVILWTQVDTPVHAKNGELDNYGRSGCSPTVWVNDRGTSATALRVADKLAIFGQPVLVQSSPYSRMYDEVAMF